MFERTAQAWGERQPKPPKPRRRPRVLMWVILAVQVLFAWWLLASFSPYTGPAPSDGEAVGSAVAAVLILFVWALVNVILGVVWLVTRRR
jgi:hypothetical protein